MEGENQTCQTIITLKKKKEEEKEEGGGDVLREVKWEDMSQESNFSDSMESSDSEADDDYDDASSSPSSSADGPLFQLSDLMNQLPIRRGLSKHYQGKSQSFTSLAHVRNLEDLAKKVSPYGISSSSYHRMKTCKSYAAFDKYGAKPTHKSSRGSF